MSASAPGTAFSASEMMIVAAARELARQRVCFVGVGLPNIAVNLAKRTVAPELELVYEAGVFGARPARLPLSIGDPTIVTHATAVTSMFELFGYYLQGGLIDVGFLGAAQIDRHGNLNSTVIGPYDAPKTRLPGSGGACEIAQNAKSIFVIMRQSPRSFVERLDFRTSVGTRVRVVITDLGVYHLVDGELTLDALHEGVTIEQVQGAMGWTPRVSASLAQTPAPTDGELRMIREELDPAGIYTK
ncbi:MAG: glutaconate CoA-transferase, subunit [Chloroflexota bacterium]|nr:glutaconate CoA-transferase, subunit [Chloroflexota bacterium]